MSIREWFRQMRATEDGTTLACEIDQILSGERAFATVYGITICDQRLAHEHAIVEAWRRRQRLVASLDLA